MTTSQVLREGVIALKTLFGTAAQLAKKQAALATLSSVTLPKLHYAIGKRLISATKLPADLEQHRATIRQLEEAAAAKSPTNQEIIGEGVAAKATRFAKSAVTKAAKATADAATLVQVRAAYVSMGKEAVEKYGVKVIPKDMQKDFDAAMQRLSALESEVSLLRTSELSGFATPSRMTLIAIGLFCLAWFLPAARLELFSVVSLSGWSAFRHGLNGSWILKAASLTNVIACVSIATLLGWPRPTLAGLGLLRILLSISFLWNLPLVFGGVRVGYIVWMASFACLFLALSERYRQLARTAPVQSGLRLQASSAVVGSILGGMFGVLLLNSAAALFSKQPLSPAETAIFAPEPPPQTARDQSTDDRQSRVDAVQVLFNALATAAAIRHAEEERIRRQQAIFATQPQPLPAVAPPYNRQMSPPSPRAANAATRRTQQFEGVCTKCGWKTGRQVMPSDPALMRASRTCTNIAGKDDSGFGLRSCGGVIQWSPVD